MLTGDTEQKLSRLAHRVWAGKRRDASLPERLLRDPASFLQENGIAIPAAFETRAAIGANSVSFRFLPRDAACDAAPPVLGDGSIFFRFEFQWIWD